LLAIHFLSGSCSNDFIFISRKLYDFVGYFKENLNIDDVNTKILESLKRTREGEQIVEELE
jgi:hypothetical protein